MSILNKEAPKFRRKPGVVLAEGKLRTLRKGHDTDVRDGRKLRATNRTYMFSTKIKPEFKDEIDTVCQKLRKTRAEWMEECMPLFKAKYAAQLKGD